MKKIISGLTGIAVAGTVAAAGSVYDFTLDTIDGTPQPLSAYQGQVLLIVNVASRCGFTKQYAGLQTLYERYKDQGFLVLGFPANNFGGQEPGTNEEIQEFCKVRFGVEFPLFGKISVKGKDIHPLYTWLTSHPNGAPVAWNFNKFLIGRNGELIAHFGSRVTPESEELNAAIATALNTGK